MARRGMTLCRVTEAWAERPSRAGTTDGHGTAPLCAPASSAGRRISCTPARTACGARQAGGAGRSGNQACEHTSFACAEIGYQRFHRVVHVAVRDVISWPRRVPALMSDPVQLSLTLLHCLERAILLQGDHNRLDLACPEDHLMVSDLCIERQGPLAHTCESPPRTRFRRRTSASVSALARRPAPLEEEPRLAWSGPIWGSSPAQATADQAAAVIRTDTRSELACDAFRGGGCCTLLLYETLKLCGQVFEL